MPLLLHKFILREGSRSAKAPAVFDKGRSFSFAQLEGAVGRAVAGLYAQGIGPGKTVQILGEAGFEMLAVLLGTLAVGAQYVPISSSYPADRLTDLGQRLEFGLCVHDGSVVAQASATHAHAPVVAAGDLLQGTRGDWRDAATIGPDDPAYTIFTSGTTGLPKGIEMTHRSALTYLQGITALGLTGPDDRLVSVSPFQFDLSLIDLALSLAMGGAIVFLSRSQLHMARAFLAETRRIGATVLSGAPSIWTILKGAGQLEAAGHFHTVFAAGEAFAPSTFEALRATHPNMRFVNIYGQSESIACMAHVAPFGAIEGAPPVGQPVKGFDTSLVDPKTGKELPDRDVGEGELYLSGPGLFKGYFDDPAADAKALYFAKDGQRWFRTRDMLRRDAAGIHTFLRRLDNQVQVNGYRVEPDEIVLFLTGIEGVQNAHVAAHEDGLIAYLESYQDDIEKIVRCQLSNLPHYMRPRHIRVLQKFPVSASGKLDTAALNRATAEAAHV